MYYIVQQSSAVIAKNVCLNWGLDCGVVILICLFNGLWSQGLSLEHHHQSVFKICTSHTDPGIFYNKYGNDTQERVYGLDSALNIASEE